MMNNLKYFKKNHLFFSKRLDFNIFATSRTIIGSKQLKLELKLLHNCEHSKSSLEKYDSE